MSTKLANNNCSIDVVEHLMAALWSTNIDNLIIEVDNIEIPICDGSAIDWIREIKSAGILQQSEKRKVLRVEKTLEVREEDKYVIISPNTNPGIIIDLSIDFENKVIGKQRITFDSNKDSFEEGFGSARTFGFVKDLEYLHSKGLGLGASLDNCIGVSEDGIANPEGLRFKDECVRHKVLDCIGDLFLSGYYMNCKVEAYKTGHKMNNMILQKLFEEKSNYLVI
jgi:UDP-3-O-[3-hydroxymyristoyl] N-acetylglucosamine deacetylase